MKKLTLLIIIVSLMYIVSSPTNAVSLKSHTFLSTFGDVEVGRYEQNSLLFTIGMAKN